jgi:hypothetical protein
MIYIYTPFKKMLDNLHFPIKWVIFFYIYIYMKLCIKFWAYKGCEYNLGF